MKFRPNPGTLIALSIVVVLVLWMFSGYQGQTDKVDPNQIVEDRRSLMRVQVKTLPAKQVQQIATVHGKTAAKRSVTLRAEVEGRITQVHVEKGQPVRQGQPIVDIDQRDLKARRQQMAALLAQRKIELQGVKDLVARKLQNQRSLAESQAAFESAQADLAGIDIALANTRIYAPFSGVLEDRHVELGQLVQIGESIGELLDYNPMLVTGQVPEQIAPHISLGQAGEINLITREKLYGAVSYLASAAQESTRSFKIELEVHQGSSQPTAGVTATMHIPLDAVWATFISPALLSLDAAGNLGVMLVDQDNRAQFHMIDIIKSDADGVWVAGLPNPARIITVGHSFVNPGQEVEPAIDQSGGYETQPPKTPDISDSKEPNESPS